MRTKPNQVTVKVTVCYRLAAGLLSSGLIEGLGAALN